MKKAFSFFCIFAFIATGACHAWAQEEKPFNARELKKFIADFPEIADHAEKMGDEMDIDQDDPDAWRSIAASSAMTKFLKKKGWQPERFAYIVSHVGAGLAGLSMAEHQPAITAQMAEAAKSIKDNPALSDEMKEQLMSQLQEGMGAATQYANALDELPESEIKLLKQNKDKLMELFDR